MEDLPRGWTEASIEELAGSDGLMTDGDWIESKDQNPNGEVRLIQLADVGDGVFQNRSSRFLTAETAERLRCTYLQKGDLLIARMPDPLGRACLFPGLKQPCVTAVDVCIWRAGVGAADPRWLMHVINSPEVRDRIQVQASGTTRQRISGGNLKRLVLSVPPLAEQRRIVARIEALFARTRRARAELGRTRALASHLLERSRASIFSNVTSSEKVGGQRFADLPPYTPPMRFEGLPDLPPGWRWVQMDAIAQVAGGLTKNKERNSLATRMPYLRVANVYADELKLEEVATIGVTNAERERVSLRAGDLLVVEGNGSLDQIGRVAVWAGGVEGCGHQNHLIRVRPLGGVPSRWLLHWLMSPYGRAVLEAAASSSSGLHTLSLSKIASLPVPLPSSSDEAEAVIEAVDAALARGQRAEAEATRALTLLDRLDAAILARAFRGELVPQDPADEPARLPSLPTATRARRSRAAPPA